MRAPIIEVLEKNKNHLSFHTPGHNGGIVLDSRLDVTELSFSDNLLSATGAIKESQNEVAKAYGVERVLYSTAGATTLILTVIRALRKKGAFLIYGDAHKSVYNGLRINGVKSYFYKGKDLEKAIDDTQAKVVICTSPNYFGSVLNLAKISNVCKDKGVILVVDASHGAHFAFSSKLPISATEYAPLVIHSQHKVMKTLTGGASLCYKAEYEKELLTAFRELHTTSPSYLILTSIESAVKECAESGEELYAKAIEEIESFTKKETTNYKVIKTDDPTRLVIEVKCDGEWVSKQLEREGVYAETVYGNKIVFIVTPYNAKGLTRLAEVLGVCDYSTPYNEIVIEEKEELIELVLDGECEEISLDDCVGRVSYREVGLYPPGVPVIVPGEKISREKAEFLKDNLNITFGLEKASIVVLK